MSTSNFYYDTEKSRRLYSIIRFQLLSPEEEMRFSEESEYSIGDALQLHKKFPYLINDGFVDMVIISHVKLSIEMVDCPVSPDSVVCKS